VRKEKKVGSWPTAGTTGERKIILVSRSGGGKREDSHGGEVEKEGEEAPREKKGGKGRTSPLFTKKDLRDTNSYAMKEKKNTTINRKKRRSA